MCNDTYRWLEDPTELFHCPEDLFSVCSSLLPHSPLATTDLFTVSVVLLFLECCIIGIMKHVAFSDWLLSLSSMHLGFFRVILWLDRSFLFRAE